MRIPRSKGAVSGLILIVLGAWGALIPLVGPYFNWVIGSDDAWDWTAGRWWLSILPGAVTIIGGAMLCTAARRRDAALGAWLAAAAGTWFVVGPTVSRSWNDGASQTGVPYGGTTQQILEQLTYFSVLGAAIVALSTFALGRMAAWTRREEILDDRLDDRRTHDSGDQPAEQQRAADEEGTVDDRRPFGRGFARRRQSGAARGGDRTGR